MPPSVANFLSSPAKLTKNVNNSFRPAGSTPTDSSAFPQVLERAERTEAQKPPERQQVAEGRAAKSSKKSAKAQTSRKPEKQSEEPEESAGPTVKGVKKEKTEDAQAPDDLNAAAEVEDTPEAKAEAKDAASDVSDAEASAAQCIVQSPAPTPADAVQTNAHTEQGEDETQNEKVAVITPDSAAETKGEADPNEAAEGDAHPDGNQNAAFAKSAAGQGTKSGAKEAVVKASAKTDESTEPALGATTARSENSHPHAKPAAEQLDAATTSFAALSGATDAASADDGPVANAPTGDGSSHAATLDAMLASGRSASAGQGPQKVDAAPAPAAPPRTPEARFVEENHEKIVSSVKTDLLPGGGTMRIRLDPPELGPMAVSVHMRDGVMTATFETSSDDAARMLSHSLGQLKSSLEAQGVSVEKLHVQQAPKSSESKSGDDSQQQRESQSPQQEASARQEQQRKEMLRRMWRKLSGFQDPLDVTG